MHSSLRPTSVLTLAAALLLGAAAAAHHADSHAHGHDHGAHAHSHATQDDIGKPGAPARVTRTIAVDMSDGMRFTPASIEARADETVRFVITNSGRMRHEFILGSAADLAAHAEAMKSQPEMEHTEPNMLTLAPGDRGEIVWQFTRGGQVDFGCLQPGHFDAGMKGAVVVQRAGRTVP